MAISDNEAKKQEMVRDARRAIELGDKRLALKIYRMVEAMDNEPQPQPGWDDINAVGSQIKGMFADQDRRFEDTKKADLGDHLYGITEGAIHTGAAAIGTIPGVIVGGVGALGAREGNRLNTFLDGLGMFTYEPESKTGKMYGTGLDLGLSLVNPASAAKKLVKKVVKQPTPTPTPTPIQDTDDIAEVLSKTNIEDVAGKALHSRPGSADMKAFTDTAKPNPDRVHAATEMKVLDDLQADALTDSHQYQSISQLAKSQPGSAAKASEQAGLSRVREKFVGELDTMGRKGDVSDFNYRTQDKLTNYQRHLDERAKHIYRTLGDAINPTTAAPAQNLLKWIDEYAVTQGGVKNLPARMRRLRKDLAVSEDGVLPTYGYLDRVRRELTSARVSKAGPYKDADKWELQNLERELLSDQRNVVEHVGSKELLELFDEGRKVVGERKTVEKQLINLYGKLENKDIVNSIRTASTALSKGSVAPARSLLSKLPEGERHEAVVQMLGYGFRGTSNADTFSFKQYNRWFEGVRGKKESQKLLNEYLEPEQVKRLQYIYEISKGVEQAGNKFITTGKAVVGNNFELAAQHMVEKLVKAAIKIGKFVPGTSGIAHAGDNIVTGVMKSGKSDVWKKFDDLVLSPEFRRATLNPKDEKVAKSMVRSKAFRVFASEIGITPIALRASLLGHAGLINNPGESGEVQR